MNNFNSTDETMKLKIELASLETDTERLGLLVDYIVSLKKEIASHSEALVLVKDHVAGNVEYQATTTDSLTKLFNIISAHTEHLDSHDKHLATHDKHLESHDKHLGSHDKHLQSHDGHLKTLG